MVAPLSGRNTAAEGTAQERCPLCPARPVQSPGERPLAWPSQGTAREALARYRAITAHVGPPSRSQKPQLWSRQEPTAASSSEAQGRALSAAEKPGLPPPLLLHLRPRGRCRDSRETEEGTEVFSTRRQEAKPSTGLRALLLRVPVHALHALRLSSADTTVNFRLGKTDGSADSLTL